METYGNLWETGAFYAGKGMIHNEYQFHPSNPQQPIQQPYV